MVGYGFSLNGVHSDTFGILCRTARELLPAREPNEIVIPGRNGSYDFGNPTFGKRTFSMQCHIQAASLVALRTATRNIAKWLADATELVFDDDPGKRWTGRVYAAVGLETAAITGQFTVAFEAQPFAEDTALQTGSIGTAQNYGSQLDIYPTITVTMGGTAASVLLTHLASGRFVRVTDTMASGNVLVFDMARGLVTRNAVAIMPKVSIDSLFFSVPPGSQTITVTTSAAYTASMVYRRRYL